MTESLRRLRAGGFIIDVDPEGTARLLSGASLHAAQWIANADDPAATSKRAVKAFKSLLEGLRRRRETVGTVSANGRVR
jgi:hypothetical protein